MKPDGIKPVNLTTNSINTNNHLKVNSLGSEKQRYSLVESGSS
jgi:hypothetical protein